jgi:hypothetical protein
MKPVILFFILITIFNLRAGAQRLSKSAADFTGTWRWVSSNADTLLIRLVPANETPSPNRPVLAEIFGFHRYIKDGKLIETNFDRVGDTLSKIASIGGIVRQNSLQMTLWDLTHKDYLSGTLRIIDELPGKAILTLSWPGERNPNPSGQPLTDARTIPNNIVLEKIR